MDQLFKHVNAEIADMITATQRSREYKIEVARAAGRAMVEALNS